MLQDLNKHKVIWLITAALTIVAALAGIISPSIYNKVITPSLLPGAVGQDIISLAAAILLAILAIVAKEDHPKKQIAALGLLGYLFYAYGIYVIEQAYNMYYLAYLAIWALSFWGIAYAITNLKKDVIEKFGLSDRVRKSSIAVSLLQPLVFYPLWISALLPLMRERNKIENLFSIYIIDLCFVMPAFLILAWLLLKKRASAYVLAPALFILGFVIIFSLVVSELAKPMFNAAPNATAIVQSGALSALFLAAAIIHLYKLKIAPHAP